VRCERSGGPTPSGGAYSEAIIDDEGRIVEIVECDASGKPIARTYGESSRADRFNSESWLVPASMPRVLIVASDLLRDLGVSRAPRDAQRSSVARWLAGNEPSAVLLASLRRADLI
jgi:hypothetical protein